MTDYQEQIARTKRYYNKLKRISDGSQDVLISKETEDNIYAFFQNCYHIKDYLKNDSAYRKHTNQQIENYINSTFELSLCADICNGLKHLSLRTTRSGSAPKIGGKKITLTVNQPVTGDATETTITSKLEIKIQHAGDEYDAFDIATKAVEKWDNFIDP